MKDYIVASYISGVYDVNRNTVLADDDYSIIQDWANSISALKLQGIIFHNNCSVATCERCQNEYITFIKIDIEGHELSAFEGMKELLTKHSPMIWLEDLNMQGVEYLKSLGYFIKESNPETFDYLMSK